LNAILMTDITLQILTLETKNDGSLARLLCTTQK